MERNHRKPRSEVTVRKNPGILSTRISPSVKRQGREDDRKKHIQTRKKIDVSSKYKYREIHSSPSCSWSVPMRELAGAAASSLRTISVERLRCLIFTAKRSFVSIFVTLLLIHLLNNFSRYISVSAVLPQRGLTSSIIVRSRCAFVFPVSKHRNAAIQPALPWV